MILVSGAVGYGFETVISHIFTNGHQKVLWLPLTGIKMRIALALWHIKHCGLLNAVSSLYI